MSDELYVERDRLAIAALTSERDRLAERVKELEQSYEREVRQFNLGHDAGEAHVGPMPNSAFDVMPDNFTGPDGMVEPDEDSWRIGFHHAGYERCVKDRAAALVQVARLRTAGLKARRAIDELTGGSPILPGVNDLWADAARHLDAALAATSDAAAWLEQHDEKVRGDAAALASFYLPGETQSSQADDAPSLRTAWEWGVSHAAVNIAAAIRQRGGKGEKG